MIRHIFKIIWNERKTNAWITLEYVLVFCVLWFCVDYLFYMGKCYFESNGFDIEHTYQINMERKPADSAAFPTENGQTEETDKQALAMTFLNRVNNYPGVESVSFSKWGAPFAWSNYMSSYYINEDTANMVTLRMRWVSDSFFDVFKIKNTVKSLSDWGIPGTRMIVISPSRNGEFGSSEYSVPLSDVKQLTATYDSAVYTVIGTTDKMKDSYFDSFYSNMIQPLDKKEYDLANMQIYIRVSPGADKDFAERFTREMRDQLMLGPYFLASVFSSTKNARERNWPTDDLNGIYAITTFLILNIFLGIIGTFWYRTQTRRSEVGLRLALGATRQGVKQMIFGETLLILFIASVVGVNICLNINQTELLELLDIPISNRIEAGIGMEQEFINYVLTFGLLATISLIAVWYPARQAAKIPPAEALRDE